MSFEWAGCTCLWMVGPQFAYESEIRPAEGVRSCSTLIDLGCVWLRKIFLENILFFENTIFGKGKCIQVFGCVGIRFTKNQFWCLVRTNILQKMTSVLRKIISSVCFRQTFYEK